MIREISTKIKPSNNNARWVFSVSISLGIALALISTFIPLYRGIVAFCGVIFIVVGIAVFSKYVSVIYYYDITFDSSEIPIFVVRQIVGGRQITLCRINIADIVKVENENFSERRRHKTPKGYYKYSYLPTLLPKSSCRLTVEGKYENAEIVIENELYAELLSKNAEIARNMDLYNE